MLKADMTRGQLIDFLFELRATRLDKAKEVDVLKKEETALVKELMTSLHDADENSVSGKLATFSIKEHTVPKVVDYNKLKEYIMETGFVHILGRTVSAPAAREIWDIDESIPGVEPLTLDKHSLTRSTK
jgi:hypothetical protein